MTKKSAAKPARKPSKRPARRKAPPIDLEQEKLFQLATLHLITHVGGLLVATDVREEVVDGATRWIFEVTLRYPTGFGGYVGDLLYDGKRFAMLTDEAVLDERCRQIAADPRGIEEWERFCAANSRSGKK